MQFSQRKIGLIKKMAYRGPKEQEKEFYALRHTQILLLKEKKTLTSPLAASLLDVANTSQFTSWLQICTCM